MFLGLQAETGRYKRALGCEGISKFVGWISFRPRRGIRRVKGNCCNGDCIGTNYRNAKTNRSVDAPELDHSFGRQCSLLYLWSFYHNDRSKGEALLLRWRRNAGDPDSTGDYCRENRSGRHWQFGLKQLHDITDGARGHAVQPGSTLEWRKR